MLTLSLWCSQVFIHFQHSNVKNGQFVIPHECVIIKVTQTGFSLVHAVPISRKTSRCVFVSLPDTLKTLDLLAKSLLF